MAGQNGAWGSEEQEGGPLVGLTTVPGIGAHEDVGEAVGVHIARPRDRESQLGGGLAPDEGLRDAAQATWGSQKDGGDAFVGF